MTNQWSLEMVTGHFPSSLEVTTLLGFVNRERRIQFKVLRTHTAVGFKVEVDLSSAKCVSRESWTWKIGGKVTYSDDPTILAANDRVTILVSYKRLSGRIIKTRRLDDDIVITLTVKLRDTDRRHWPEDLKNTILNPNSSFDEISDAVQGWVNENPDQAEMWHLLQLFKERRHLTLQRT